MIAGRDDDKLGIAARWPDLFIGLTSEERSAVVRTCANSWHSGWEPKREDVADVVAVVRGGSVDEAIARATEEALRSD